MLEDVFSVADTITVLRNGCAMIHRRPRGALSVAEVIKEMLGETVAERARPTSTNGADPAKRSGGAPLQLSGVTVRGALKPFDLEARPGEIVGFAGLEGSGAHVVFDAIFGRRRLDGGRIVLPDQKPAPRTPNGAVRHGVAFVPADRKRLGLMLDKSVSENVCTVSGGPLRRLGTILRKGEMSARTEHWAQELKITMRSPNMPVGQLSGGNQQKVVFAKWLEAAPSVVLLDDPSRGVDVGARVDMHHIIKQLSERRCVVLITASDLEELADVCDRVIVFYQGEAVGEIPGDELGERRLLQAITTGVL
jgi:ABC-type sugar transport system ATPase subunit